jgi:hypothetical protein
MVEGITDWITAHSDDIISIGVLCGVFFVVFIVVGARVRLKLDNIKTNGIYRAGSARNVELLIKSLRGKEKRWHQLAAKQLGIVGDPRAVEPLLAALQEAEPRRKYQRQEYVSFRQSAARALGAIGDARAVGGLIGMLNDKDWGTRSAAAEALGKIGDSQAVEPLLAALSDEYPSVRQCAIKALVHLKDERAVRPLIQLLTDAYEDVREATRLALIEFKGKRFVNELVAPAKADREKTERCMVCQRQLSMDRALKLGQRTFASIEKELESAAYRCRKCGALICMVCAQKSLCSRCGGNTFDMALR